MPILASEGEAQARKTSGHNPRPVAEQALRCLARNLLSRNSEVVSFGVRVRSAILAMGRKPMGTCRPAPEVLV
jgi:hypothetical protein